MLSAFLALSASLTWGVGDFLGGVKARVLPALTVLATSQPFGLAALGVAVAVRGTGIPGDEVGWSALAAVFGTVGLLAFYRGMAAGAISVVASGASTTRSGWNEPLVVNWKLSSRAPAPVIVSMIPSMSVQS